MSLTKLLTVLALAVAITACKPPVAEEAPTTQLPAATATSTTAVPAETSSSPESPPRPETVGNGADRYELLDISIVTTDGGRVDYSPDGSTIAFDRLGDDEKWDVWLMDEDGSNDECLTCGHAWLGDGDMGQPAYHPSGEWLVFQRETPEHQNQVVPTHPGAGVFNDLVIMRMSDREVFMLNDVGDGTNGSEHGGTLHAVFSHSGEQLLWTDYERGCWSCIVGDWQIALADFVVDDDIPSLTNRQNFSPGEEDRWFETHGFGPSDDWIYFSGATEGQNFLASDTIRMDLDTAPEYVRLTKTAGPRMKEQFAYDEHTKLTPLADAMMWLNDESGISEYWMMNPDGSGRYQVTNFNTDGAPESDLVDGKRSVPSDNAWHPAPPPGKAIALSFVQVDFNPLAERAPLNYIVRLEFAYDGN